MCRTPLEAVTWAVVGGPALLPWIFPRFYLARFIPRPQTNGGCRGGLAQLARAPALQAGGQRFESVILHQKHIDMLEAENRTERPPAALTGKPAGQE